TLGGNAGEVLVGLTLRPGTPGQNAALVYLLPPDGERPTIAAELRVGDLRVELARCGATCRAADVELRGGERLEVRVPDVGGTRGGTAAFDLPALPAADGADLLGRARRRMRALRSYRVDEWLGPAGVPGVPRVYSALAYRAPDRMRLEVDNGFQRVWVGDTRYARDRADAPWRVEGVGPQIAVPRFDWDGEVVGARVVGRGEVDGTATEIVAFFTRVGRSPAWFRLWVDADGLVRRSGMGTESAHFMEDRFRDFDAPFTIEAPVP
ncbi:MAG TPA: hypothetical protein VG370_13980, partial [Chloroflexota bacterium]|nr:hypothetical protein [Chloroflexota bacterium]